MQARIRLWGVEPVAGFDGSDHYLDITVPRTWSTKQQIQLRSNVLFSCRQLVHCRCREWTSKHGVGQQRQVRELRESLPVLRALFRDRTLAELRLQ